MSGKTEAWPNGMPAVGQTARRTRRVSPFDIERFTAMSGDRNPIHYDDALARDTRFGGIVVQGGVTTAILNAVVAEDLPGPGTVFLQVNWRFKEPVRPGDAITGEVTVTGVREDKPITELDTRVIREDGTVVLDGTAVCYTLPLPAGRGGDDGGAPRVKVAPRAGYSTPLLHVADVARSIRFYRHLGFTLIDTEGEGDRLGWARMHCEGGALMFVPAQHPPRPRDSGVLLYLYTSDLPGLRDHLLAQGLEPLAIAHPEYMPSGEFGIEDPDGYVVLIGHWGDAEHEAWLKHLAERAKSGSGV